MEDNNKGRWALGFQLFILLTIEFVIPWQHRNSFPTSAKILHFSRLISLGVLLIEIKCFSEHSLCTSPHSCGACETQSARFSSDQMNDSLGFAYRRRLCKKSDGLAISVCTLCHMFTLKKKSSLFASMKNL